jgi:phosphoribosylformylglycinamidine synthase
MTARIGVVTFPGSLDDRDAMRAIRLTGGIAVPVWYASDSLTGIDAIILPGGFSYGDYLRCGAIARFAPIMTEIIHAAERGMPVLGICNGFQVLCEAHLLPGALIKNQQQAFDCRTQPVTVESTGSVWTSQFTPGQRISVVLKNGEGRFVATDETLDQLEERGQVALRYLGRNPNGSARDIAGITNQRGNVLGLMPHPEHSVDPLTGAGKDGTPFFTGVLELAGTAAAEPAAAG